LQEINKRSAFQKLNHKIVELPALTGPQFVALSRVLLFGFFVPKAIRGFGQDPEYVKKAKWI
jgi:hypothetical protein